MDEARRFAAAIHAKFPGKLLAYNCSPSFNWAAKLNAAAMKKWREELGRARLPLSIHHACRLACAEPVDVRIGLRLQRGRHAGLLATAAARIRSGSGRLSGHQAPSIRRHRLFRCGADRDQRQEFDRRDGRQHRDRAVPCECARNAWWPSTWPPTAPSHCAQISPPTTRRRSPSIFASITRSSAASRGAPRDKFSRRGLARGANRCGRANRAV